MFRTFGFVCVCVCMSLSRVNHMLCICTCMQSLAAIAFLWHDKPLFLSVDYKHTYGVCCICCVVERSFFFSFLFISFLIHNFDIFIVKRSKKINGYKNLIKQYGTFEPKIRERKNELKWNKINIKRDRDREREQLTIDCIIEYIHTVCGTSTCNL